MPGPRLPMRKIRDVLRLSAAGMSKRKIAASLGVSATAAGECMRRTRRAGPGCASRVPRRHLTKQGSRGPGSLHSGIFTWTGTDNDGTG